MALKVSIIIPAFYEEGAFIALLEAVNRQKITGVSLKVIVVDDGSKDSAVELFAKRPALYSEFIKIPINGGKGEAIAHGIP